MTERTAGYWTSGADGVLRIARCSACGHYQHPPLPLCPRCHGSETRFEPVAGRGTVYSFTINRYQWNPDMTPPYVLAEVELPEQQNLRVMAAITGCEPEEVYVGQPVTVAFERAGETWIPVFRP
ncbi:Zn-ribbon domain-containing OB-fold protein [Streptomyces sp. NPDC002577]